MTFDLFHIIEKYWFWISSCNFACTHTGIDVSIRGARDLPAVKEYVGKSFGSVIIVEYIIKNRYNYTLERK